MRKVPLHRVAIKPKSDRAHYVGEQQRVTFVYMCAFFRPSEIEEFTSLSRARAYIYFPVSPPGRMSRRLVLFRGLVRLVESVEFRGFTSRRLSSSFRPYIPSIRCSADSMSMQSKRRPRHGCQLSVIYGSASRTHP